jgi:hypothetical protein
MPRPAPPRRPVPAFLGRALFTALLALGGLGLGCAETPQVAPSDDEGFGGYDSTPPGGGGAADGTGDGTGNGGGDEPACLLHDCASDAECAACGEGRTHCRVAEHRCVACDEGGCPEGQTCSSFGNCVPAGVTCPTDAHGDPTITCTTSADCVACDPMHQVCDTGLGKCVACTSGDTSACLASDLCLNDMCSAKCPASCTVDNDCGQCGTPPHLAHACNAHKCAECSPTYACPAGKSCSPQGVCVELCGKDGKGTCDSDADCDHCGANATTCHKPLNASGSCGPAAAGCSDLGNGALALGAPWDQVTNTCSNDGDCDGVGVKYDIGKALRDLTGLDAIKDAEVDYGMNVCASVTVGIGGKDVSCGVCVPCKVDSDCKPIDIDKLAGEAFGPVGSIAAKLLLNQVFGDNPHEVQFYCQAVAGGYGVCAPCPGLIYACGVDSGGGGGGGGGGSCDHDTCTMGGALSEGCDSCAQSVCAADSYCCQTQWDQTCVSEVAKYCGQACGGGGGAGCAHDECSAGDKLDAGCSDCATQVCGQDSFCCSSSWDDTCVNEAKQACGCN